MAEIWTRRPEDNAEHDAATVQRMKFVSIYQKSSLCGAIISELIASGWMHRLGEMARTEGHPQRYDALWVLCNLVAMEDPPCTEIILMCRLGVVSVFVAAMGANESEIANLGVQCLANLMNDMSYAVAEFAAGAAQHVLHLWCHSSDPTLLELCSYFMGGFVKKKSREDFDGQPVLCTLPMDTLLPVVSLMSKHFETVIMPQIGAMLQAHPEHRRVLADVCCGALHVNFSYLKLWAGVVLDQHTVLSQIALVVPAVRVMQHADVWAQMLADSNLWDQVADQAVKVIDCIAERQVDVFVPIAPNPQLACSFASMCARVAAREMHGTPVELLNLEHNLFHHINAFMRVMVMSSARFSMSCKMHTVNLMSNIALDSDYATTLAIETGVFRSMVELCRQLPNPSKLWDLVVNVFVTAASQCPSDIFGNLCYHFAMQLDVLPVMASFINRYAHHSPTTTRGCISFFVQLMSAPSVGDDVKNALKARLWDMDVADTLGRIQTTGRSEALVEEATCLLRFIEDDDDDYVDSDTKLMLLDNA